MEKTRSNFGCEGYKVERPHPAATDRRPTESNESETTQHISNYSIQTGEEFSLEFMRERRNSKKVFGYSDVANIATHYTDIKSILGHRASAVESDISINLSFAACPSEGLDATIPSEGECNESQELSREALHVELGDVSSRGASEYYVSSSSKNSSRLEFLCSYGGRILPRPSDGRLRYVGGHTHILRLRKDISWREFKQKTHKIFGHPHVIKYQLPGEELDALITVSCAEDLENMFEECLQSCDQSKKFRLLLFSSEDVNEMHYLGHSLELEIKYIIAVNCMGFAFEKKCSNHFDSISKHVPSIDGDVHGSFRGEKIPNETMGSSSLISISDPSVPVMHSSTNNNYECDAHTCCHVNDKSIVPSTNYTRDISNILHSKTSLPTVCKNDFLPSEIQRLATRISAPVAQFEATKVTSVFNSSNQEAYENDSLKTDHSSHLQDDGRPGQDLKHEYLLVENPGDGYESGMVSSNKEKCSVAPVEHLASQALELEGQCSDVSQSFSIPEMVVSEQIYGINYVSNSQTSVMCLESVLHRNHADSHYCGAFHSERIPREKSQLISRLSKSDESIASQFPLLQSDYSYISEGESSPACINQFETDKMASPDEQTIFSITNNHPSSSSIGGKLKQLREDGEHADPIVQKKQNESISKPGLQDVSHLKKATIYEVPQPGTSQTDIDSEGGLKMGFVVGKLNLVNSELNDIQFVRDDASQLKADCSVPCGKNISLDSFEKGSAAKHSVSRKFSHDFDETLFIRSDSKPQSQCVPRDLPVPEILSPALLSDIFSRAMMAENSSNAMGLIDVALSFNMTNLEPKSWSFFRNLAHNEFNNRENDIPLIDQNSIGCTSPNIAHETSQGYVDEVVTVGCIASQSDLANEMGQDFATMDHTITATQQVSIPSSSISQKKSELSDESANVDGCFFGAGEEEILEIGENFTHGPRDDFVPRNLQKIKNEDLEELKELGSGTYGTVYHGKWRGTDVAIKRIKKSCFVGRASEQDRLMQDFWREADILSQLHHPNIVAFYGVVQDKPWGALATVTEYMVDGSLRQVLQRKDRYLEHRKRLKLAMDAAFGVEYLHTKNVVHFDLKCDNLLVNLKDPVRPICKVGDFGLSRIKRNTLISGGIRGTLPWMAPELLYSNDSKVSDKVDVFSFGIVMWEILTGEEPYADMHHGAIIGGIVSNTLRPPVPKSCDPDWRTLMVNCWAADPAQRPSFTEIVGRLRSMTEALQRTPLSKLSCSPPN